MRSQVQSDSKVFAVRNRSHSSVLPDLHRGASGELSASRSFLGTNVPYLNMVSWAFMILIISFDDRALTLVPIAVVFRTCMVPIAVVFRTCMVP